MNASDDLPPPLPGRGKRRSIALLIAAIAALIPLVLFLNYRLSGPSATEQLIARIKQRGEPLTLAELAASRPPVPDCDNGALLLLQAWGPDAPACWDAFREGRKEVGRPSPNYDRGLPFLGSDMERVPRLATLDPTNTAAAEAFLAEREAHLEAVRLALRQKQFRFPVQITNGAMLWLPHLGEIRVEGKSFRIAGLMALERGDAEAAIGALEDAARAGRALAADPLLFSQLVRLTCYGTVLEDLERLLSRKALSAAQLDRLTALVEEMQVAGALRLALISERAFILDAMSRPAEWFSQFGGGGMAEPVTAKHHVASGVLSFSGLLDADRRLMLETLVEAIALAGRDDAAALQRGEELLHNAQESARRFPPKLFTSMLLPGAGTVTRFGRFEARRRAALVALAVERHRLTHEGRLPEQLDELAPQFPAGIPKDPFDGNPLRFQPLPEGFVVYSIGKNRMDDGGREPTSNYSNKDADETVVVER